MQLKPTTRVSKLADLPPPPGGKEGWPWTEASPPLPEAMEDGSPWPRITVITPSFNQGRFLEATVRSILLQGYPNLEYIVIDGGSSDDSPEIIRKYERFLTIWVSEPDRGQSHAINKGLSVATGSIVNWINSDDYLTPSALEVVARAFRNCDMVAGGNIFFGNGRSNRPMFARGLTASQILRRGPDSDVQQMAMWVHREGMQACGGLDESMHYAFDADFYVRYLHQFPRVRYVDAMLGWYRKHEASKTVACKQNFIPERRRTIEKLQSDPRFADLSADWKVGLKRYEWWTLLAETVNEAHASGLRRAVRIVRNASIDPSVRWDRVTRRTVRKLLRGRELRPFAAAH